ncbi:hypothetical protein COSHB9_23900 [Companilactobacillus alimentarius]|uniref:Transposase n=1 Tax=Companilactobacillus alimentarius DSM 20249 TaxID=1423720 RepID=A0A2K9HEU4_9LACO|nr:helix-turn-helix domain-containing protein [Companilactobacillus alimentarius]AUI71079.1 transposase [Companilactobacillus alimentarius DSM 20249]KRK75199.1 hypothetical protein FC67_GL001712 [Companilactobacillus alimentarius DSM 20249]MDT6951664.1 helix-turn-helix domain-containing protein [Companilactobacillus alimentarius]GEO44023.1 hypothetical protein LAL01_02550 [Companilactobacillus alimentarius]
MNYNKEQQKEIAQYAVEHDNDYKATGEKYGISYQQVAAWVRKYLKVTKTNQSQKKSVTTKKAPQANALDILSRKDPILEEQLHEVKKRLGLE